jgi:hypothetical protein
MGNIFITAISIFIPITIHTSIIPTLWRPDILGGSPWSSPNKVVYFMMYFFFLYLFLWLFSVIGNIYYSLFNCNKKNVKMSMLMANWTPFFAFAGMFLNNTLFLPFVKGLILSATTMIPYSHHLVNGLLTAPFVFIGTMFSQKYLNQMVCGFY